MFVNKSLFALSCCIHAVLFYQQDNSSSILAFCLIYASVCCSCIFPPLIKIIIILLRHILHENGTVLQSGEYVIPSSVTLDYTYCLLQYFLYILFTRSQLTLYRHNSSFNMLLTLMKYRYDRQMTDHRPQNFKNQSAHQKISRIFGKQPI